MWGTAEQRDEDVRTATTGASTETGQSESRWRGRAARDRLLRQLVAAATAVTAVTAIAVPPASAAPSVSIAPRAQCHGTRCFVEVQHAGATPGATLSVTAGGTTRSVVVRTRSGRRVVEFRSAALADTVVARLGSAVARSRLTLRPFAVNRPTERCATLQATNVWLSVGPPSPVDASINLPARGTLRTAVLFVDFPGATGTGDPRPTTLAWMEEGIEHLRRSSAGRFDMEIVDTTDVWVRLPTTPDGYGLTDGVTYDEHRVYIQDAIDAADAEVDFTDVQLTILVVPPTAGLWGSLAFRGLPDSLVTGEGTRNAAVTFGSDALTTAGVVFSHEVAHTLGLPDLYGIGESDLHRYVGTWDYMGSIFDPHTDLFAWQRTQIGWLDPQQTLCANGRTVARLAPLASRGGVKAVFVRTGPFTGVVVENRAPLGNDRDICREGVLVYTVDSRVNTGDGPIRVAGGTVGGCGSGRKSDATLLPGESRTVAGVTVSVVGRQGDTAEVVVVG